jgi:hypothetical protein
LSRKTFAFSTSAAIALAAATGLAGCSTAQTKSKDETAKTAVDDEVRINTFKDDDLYTGIPASNLTFRDDKGDSHTSDDDVIFDPQDKSFDSVLVAQWVKSRRSAMDWCKGQRRSDLGMNERGGNETPPYLKAFPDDPKRPENRLDQAIAIALKIIQKVPDTPEVHLRLAQMCFVLGSYHFWVVDAGAWGILDSRDKGDDEKAKKIESNLEPHRKRMIAYHIVALQQFQAYESAMPMHHPSDYYWKINFQLGNFDQALKFLQETLDNPDLKADLRSSYEDIEKQIKNYLVEVKLNDAAPKPLSPERVRKNGGKRSEGFGDD